MVMIMLLFGTKYAVVDSRVIHNSVNYVTEGVIISMFYFFLQPTLPS